VLCSYLGEFTVQAEKLEVQSYPEDNCNKDYKKPRGWNPVNKWEGRVRPEKDPGTRPCYVSRNHWKVLSRVYASFFFLLQVTLEAAIRK
jgi:hypothetical protein